MGRICIEGFLNCRALKLPLNGLLNVLISPRVTTQGLRHTWASRMEAVERIASYSFQAFITPKTAEPITPCAPVAQVDRATVS
jgi:hypothetical protein